MHQGCWLSMHLGLEFCVWYIFTCFTIGTGLAKDSTSVPISYGGDRLFYICIRNMRLHKGISWTTMHRTGWITSVLGCCNGPYRFPSSPRYSLQVVLKSYRYPRPHRASWVAALTVELTFQLTFELTLCGVFRRVLRWVTVAVSLASLALIAAELTTLNWELFYFILFYFWSSGFNEFVKSNRLAQFLN